jgi:hypothetical protein
MSIQDNLLGWEQLLELAQGQTSARRWRRPGQAPSTAPIPGSWHRLAPGEKPAVLLYRDTNSWCPFCERVWFALEEKEIPFETEFIDLSNKPSGIWIWFPRPWFQQRKSMVSWYMSPGISCWHWRSILARRCCRMTRRIMRSPFCTPHPQHPERFPPHTWSLATVSPPGS